MSSMTKAENINRRLLSTITELRRNGGIKLPSEMEICAELNASRGTVRRVMSGFVEAGIIKRVAGKGTFIQENRSAEIVKSGKIPIVGMAYDLVGLTEFRTKIIKSVARAAQFEGLEVMVCSIGEILTLLNNWMPTNKGFAEFCGFISCSFTPNSLRMLNDSKVKIPYVALVNPMYEHLSRYSVLRKGHFAVPFDYLCKLGHRKICVLEHDLTTPFLNQIHAVIREYKKKFPELQICLKDSDYNPSRINEEIQQTLSMPAEKRPTAFLCHDDKVASWVMDSLQSQNIKVPEDISVIGIGNFEISSFTRPRLTTISISYDNLGEEAVNLFIRQLRCKKINEPVRYVDYHIIERESAAPVTKK